MKITIEDGQIQYACDFTKLDKVNDGLVDEYYPEVGGAVDAALMLLSNVYPKKVINDYLKNTYLDEI